MMNKILLATLVAGTVCSNVAAQAKEQTQQGVQNGGTRFTVSASFSPSTVQAGQSTTFQWNATNGEANCEIFGVPGIDYGSASGYYSFVASSSLQASVSCESFDFVAGKSASLTVTAPSTPTATISYSPSTIDLGNSTTLSWDSQNASECSSNDGLVSGTAGSTSVTPSSSQTTTITCSGAAGSVSKSASVSVRLLAPYVSFYASPAQLWGPGFSTVYWDSIRATSCTWGSTSGSASTYVTQTVYYLISCSGPGGTTTAITPINVNYLYGIAAEQEAVALVQDSNSPNQTGALTVSGTQYDLSHLGLDTRKKGVMVAASDLNGDGIRDLVVSDADSKVAYILLGSSNGYTTINKRVKNVSRLQDIKSIVVPNAKGGDIVVTVEH